MDIAHELAALGFVGLVEIGQGGCGVVYRCFQASLDRTVAAKVLTAEFDDGNLERFIREQRAMGRLSSHPNIVTVLEVGTTSSGRPFIVMEYHSRGALDSLIHDRGPLDWRAVLRLGVKITDAVAAAHRVGIVHRDVKPANILITDYGNVQLTDFGIARIAGGFETGTDQISGTPAFTAPEIFGGATPTVTADLYSVGATMFCALTGHAAFERRHGESIMAQFARISNQSAPDLDVTGIPDVLSSAVQAAMAKDPAERPGSADEFGGRLREIANRAGINVDTVAIWADGSGGELFGRAPRGPGRDRGAPVDRTTVPPTLATKFRPPRHSRMQLFRPRLINALRAGGGCRLTLIHAPAGYGKTTLAAQWAEKLSQQAVKVSWLTIDDNDNDLVWFLSNLVEAIRRVAPAVASHLDGLLEERGDDAGQYVLASLINGIDACEEPVVLIVDDWQRVTSAAVKDVLGFLLEHGSDNLQVVVTSRSRSGLPLSQLQLHDELVEIDVDALCFDDDEAQSFLVDMSGLDLPRGEVRKLRSSTDGWAAGLQLVSLSLRGADAPAEMIGEISGRSRTIANFLTENVLDTLEPAMRRFLLSTSVTERTCASLASALSGEPQGQAMLEEVETRDLFLRRIDDNGNWFGYQRLFADFLRQRLARDDPDQMAMLHGRASDWFAKHQMIVEAVDHALAADDTARAVELVTVDGSTLPENSQNATLLCLVEKLPSEEVGSNPRLQLMLARANMTLHRIDVARAALQQANTTLETVQGPEAAQLRIIADVWEAALRIHQDRTDGVDELISDALARPDELPPFVVSAAANAASFSALFRFDFDAVYRWQERAVPYRQHDTGPYAARYGYVLRGGAAMEQLDFARAEQCFLAARHVEHQTATGRYPQAARFADALLAELYYQRDQLAEAQRLLDGNPEPSGEEGTVDIIAARVIVGARLALLHGDRDTATGLLDDGADVARRLSTPRLRATVENERLLMGLSSQVVQPPIAFTQRLTLLDEPVSGIDEITAQLREETAIRLLLNDSTATDRACRWAQEWVSRLQGRGRDAALLQAQRTLVECLVAAGYTAEAKHLLGSILRSCAEAGMVRFAIDGGDRVVSLIAEVREDYRNDGSELVAFLDRLLGATSAASGPAAQD